VYFSASRDLSPAPGGVAGMTLLKLHPETDSERLTRKNVLLPTPLPFALVRCVGHLGRVILAACATGRASHSRPGCCSADSHACRRTAPWRSMVRRLALGAASSVSRRGVWRAAAQLGASWSTPPRRQARAKRVTAHRAGHGRPAGERSDWRPVARRTRWLQQVEHSSRAPSLRQRQACRLRAAVAARWELGGTVL
jgi:hypothetical protein